MYLRYLYYFLWIAPVPVLVCLAAMMVRRKLHTALPLFFAFTVFQIAELGLGYFFYHLSQVQYFYAYWTLAALDLGLGFTVLYEVFAGIFHPFDGLRELGAVLFRWALVVLVLVAVLMAATSVRLPGNPIFSTILNLSRSLEVMQCGLVLLMLLCSNYLGLTLRHRIFGIALGFGIIAAVDLVAVTVLASMGQQSATAVKLSKMVAYNIATVLWFGYVYAGDVEVAPAKRLAYAEGWDYALASVLHPASHASSLPLIEDVVDRVWKGTNGKSNHAAGPPPQAD